MSGELKKSWTNYFCFFHTLHFGSELSISAHTEGVRGQAAHSGGGYLHILFGIFL